MFSTRYGDLRSIARKTAGRCHLCHQPLDLSTYGHVCLFGRETATVDHLDPQSWGGDDDSDNLLMAHHGCNSSRGTRDVEETRLLLAGTARRPMSSGERAAAGAGLVALAAAAGGVIFAQPDASGQVRFNAPAAAGTAVLAAAVLLLAAA